MRFSSLNVSLFSRNFIFVSLLLDFLPACQAELLKATMTTELIAQVSARIIGKPMAAAVSSWRSSSFIVLVVRV